MEVIYFLLLLSSQLCFGPHCSSLLMRSSGAQSHLGVFPPRAAKTMLSPALLNCPGTWAHFLHVHLGVQPASACGISLAVERAGGACEMKSPVLVAVAEHLQPAGGFNVAWQANDGKCQCFEALSGN